MSAVVLSPNLYCTLCAAPCLQPRHPPPLPPGNTSLPLTTPDQPYPTPPDSPIFAPTSTWLNQWHLLQVSHGILTSFTSIPPASQTPNSHNRHTPIHAYCLEIILKVIRKSMYNNGFSHEESVMLGWSVPKWTGFGPWVDDDLARKFRVGEGSLVIGFWRGCVDQRERYVEGAEGSHLNDSDKVSPTEITKPTSYLPSFSPHNRPIQSSPLLNLPETVILQIISHILPLPLHRATKPTTPLLPSESITTLLSLLHTSSNLLYFPIPSSTWKALTLNSVHKFKMNLLGRWRANPTGTGSAAQLWIALDEAFVQVVEKAFDEMAECDEGEEAKRDVGGDEGEGGRKGIEARDIWAWWEFDLGWRSRRRVWYCAVQGCATARDADWW